MKVGAGFNERRSRTRKGAVKAPRNHGRLDIAAAVHRHAPGLVITPPAICLAQTNVL